MPRKFAAIGLLVCAAVLLAIVANRARLPQPIGERFTHARHADQVAEALARRLVTVIRDGDAAGVLLRDAGEEQPDALARWTQGSTFDAPPDHHFATAFRVAAIDERGVLLSYRHRHMAPAGAYQSGSDHGLLRVPYFVCWRHHEALHRTAHRWQSVLRGPGVFLACVPEFIAPGHGVLAVYASP